MYLTGAEIIIKCLKEQDVNIVFGYPGGTILNIYDELYKHNNKIKHILTSHEQGAIHAADGYARSTGKTGICLATSGPGATNLVTGIATSYMDSIPIIIITCNVAVQLLGKDSFQEIDISGIVMPITKHSFMVKDIKKLSFIIKRAFFIAKNGRPGPVLIDITKDVTATKIKFQNIFNKYTRLIHNIVKFKKNNINNIINIIHESERPLIIVGGGVILSNSYNELNIFAHKIQTPVINTLMGKGAFIENDNLYIGMLGMHGTKAANLSISKCDLLIIIGMRFSDRVTGNIKNFAKNAKKIQIDIDSVEINKNVLVDYSIIGDAKKILKYLNNIIKLEKHEEWIEYINELKQKYPLYYNKNGLSGPSIINEIYNQANKNTIIVTEVGQHQMWAAQYYKCNEPRTFLSSGGLGTMGYGLGAAIGAKIGNLKKNVINIAGDGCFRMNMNEIATAVKNNIHIIQIIINNQVLGMVRQWQTLFYENRYSNTILKDKIDFIKLSESMGAIGIRVTTKKEFKIAFSKAMNLHIIVVIDCIIDSDDKVFPMVPIETNIEDTFDENDLKNKK